MSARGVLRNRPRAVGRALGLVAAGLAAGILLAGCTQKMAREPRYNPLSPSSFFGDGRSARPLVEGTVPHGALAEDIYATAPTSNAFPLPVNMDLLEHGQERFNIYCTPCHGLLGDGNGMVAQRGFRHPPSLHIARLRRAPVGHFYDVMSNGFGAMPDYADQIPARDRWAIIAYIRALQLSQNVPISQLPPPAQQELNKVLNREGGSRK